MKKDREKKIAQSAKR